MTYITGMRSAVCVAALIAGSAAHADVTAAQVWEDWKSQLSLYGEGNVNIGSEESSSGTVTIRDLTVNFSDEEMTGSTNISAIVFNEQSDGTVRVTMDESYPLILSGDDGVVVLEAEVVVRPVTRAADLAADGDALRERFPHCPLDEAGEC